MPQCNSLPKDWAQTGGIGAHRRRQRDVKKLFVYSTHVLRRLKPAGQKRNALFSALLCVCRSSSSRKWTECTGRGSTWRLRTREVHFSHPVRKPSPVTTLRRAVFVLALSPRRKPKEVVPRVEPAPATPQGVPAALIMSGTPREVHHVGPWTRTLAP